MAAQDTWEKKDKGREDSAEIQGFLQNVRTAAPSADACWEALPWFWNKWVPDFAEKDSHFGEKRRSESVQRLAMYILTDPRCIWREGVRQPTDPRIYQSLFDERREAPSDEATLRDAFHSHLRLAKFVFEKILPMWEPAAASLRREWEIAKFKQDHAEAEAKKMGRKRPPPPPPPPPEASPAKATKALFPFLKQAVAAPVSPVKVAGGGGPAAGFPPALPPGGPGTDVARVQQEWAVKLAAEFPNLNLGRLWHHPSVQFIQGFLHYKAGTPVNLQKAAKHFDSAARFPILAPTCKVLIGLCYFYTIVRKDQKGPRDFVAVLLRDALMEATGGVDPHRTKVRLGKTRPPPRVWKPPLVNEIVDLPLLVEGHSALAILISPLLPSFPAPPPPPRGLPPAVNCASSYPAMMPIRMAPPPEEEEEGGGVNPKP